MDIYEVLKNIDKQNKSFIDKEENRTGSELFYNNFIVNYGDYEEAEFYQGIKQY